MPDIHASSPLTMALGHTGLILTAGANKTIAYDALDIMYEGRTKSVAAGAAVAIPATDAITGEDFEQLAQNEAVAVLVSYDIDASSDQVKLSQGGIVKTGGDGELDPHLPAPTPGSLPDKCVPLGVLYFASLKAAKQRIGDPNWNVASDNHAKAVACGTLPARPLVTKID